MRVAFFLPGRLETVSGAHAYDRRMIAGLRAAGVAVAVHEVEGAVANLPAEAVPVIDGNALPELLGVLTARPCVGLIHHPISLETGLDDAEKARLHAMERQALPLLARIVVPSAAIAASLADEFGVDPARVTVVAPGTEQAPRSPGSGGPGCAILSVGTLLPRKGHEVLMRALARLFDLDWHLTIAGAPRDAVYADGLRALADELAIAQRVRFAGETVGAALEALWQGADIFALATYYEGYGMAIAEALKRGLPVAVTSGGAAGALVTPASGVVCEPGDTVTLSKSLRRVIFDTTLRKSMAEAAWQIGQALPDWPTQARAFAEAIALA